MLNWVKQFNIFCYLDNQQYNIAPHQYECLVAAGAQTYIDETQSLQEVDHFLKQNKHWSFGHLSYDLKNRLFDLKQTRTNTIGFPDFFFFQPEILVLLQDHQLTIRAENPGQIYQQIINHQETVAPSTPLSALLRSRLRKEEYLQKIKQLQQHILRGDCYEVNFCQEFFAENVSLDAVTVFKKLSQISPAPFSALYRLHDKYLISASPERFLVKKGSQLISQPMKGTARRNLENSLLDQQLKKALLADAKEQAENVMVVDLVRNDLSKVCNRASVKVNELFGIYTFPQVHQMVSTVSGELKENMPFSEVIAATFPMGSMTGAPKLRVMQLIEQYETVARGLFSGSVGYIDDEGNFDFNVVIRSIFYNASRKYLSYQVGSGITFYSDAEKEWDECLLKGAAIKKVLTDEPALH